MIKLLLIGVIYFICLAAYVAMPLAGKLVVIVINAFVSDPLPMIDEIFMFLSLGKHLDRLEKITNFVQGHRVAVKRVGIICIIAIIVAIIII